MVGYFIKKTIFLFAVFLFADTHKRCVNDGVRYVLCWMWKL